MQVKQRRDEILRLPPDPNHTKNVFQNFEHLSEVEHWAAQGKMDQALYRMKELGVDYVYTFETKKGIRVSGRLIGVDEWHVDGPKRGKNKGLESSIHLETPEENNEWISLKDIDPATLKATYSPFKIPEEFSTASVSQAAKKSGFSYLGHHTRNIDTLGKIFQSSILKTNVDGIGAEGFYTYALREEELEKHNAMEEFKPSSSSDLETQLMALKPKLLLDIKLLDVETYYVNRHWNYGTVDRSTLLASDKADLKRYLYLIGSKRITDDPELVFTQNILLNNLKSILVPKGSREPIIQYLRNKFSPYPRGYEDLLIEASP